MQRKLLERRRLCAGLAAAAPLSIAPNRTVGAAATPRDALAADEPAPPRQLRIGSVAAFFREGTFLGALGVARYKGWLADIEQRGTRIELVGFKGGAPLVGQALANQQIDFAGQGDLMSIIGRSAGLATRLILPIGKLSNAYLAVPDGSAIRSIPDLKGKRVAYYKGNQIHLQVLRILREHGMSERDLRSIFLDPIAAQSALAAGEIDAAFGSTELLLLRDKQTARIVYSTRGRPELAAFNALLVREAFADAYPATTARLVDALVRAADWASDEANRSELIHIWTLGNQPRQYLEDYEDRPWSDRLSPLIDPLFVDHYEQTQRQLAELKLLPGTAFDVEQWIDRRYLNAALASRSLERRWQPLDAHGRRLPASWIPTPPSR